MPHRHSLLFIVIMISFIPGSGQVPELLIGKWDYHTIRNVDDEQPINKSLLKIVVGNNSFYQFARDHSYISYENNAYFQGEWKLAENNRKLLLTSARGTIQVFEVISITKHTLVLLIKDQAYHTLVRGTEPVHFSAKGNDHETGIARASAEDICRKWVLTELRDSLETREVNIQMTEFMKGGWFDLSANGVYARKMITHEKKGHWKFHNDNSTLIMIDDDGFGAVWNICFISPGKLVLQRPGTSIQHIFTSLH